MLMVKFSYRRYEGMWMGGGIAPRINLGSIWGEWSALRRRRLNPGSSLWYPLERSLGGPQCQFGRFEEGISCFCCGCKAHC
jgi:hypothetical protein